MLDSQQVCEEQLYNERRLRTQNPLESNEQSLVYWRGNLVLLCTNTIYSRSLVALFIEPAGESILVCGGTGWSVVRLVCLVFYFKVKISSK